MMMNKAFEVAADILHWNHEILNFAHGRFRHTHKHHHPTEPISRISRKRTT
jgi:hypothetical protein